MDKYFKELPGWIFTVDEISAGVYKIAGKDKRGHSIEKTGLDPETLLFECKQYAAKIISE